jgi:hypothetical protein
MLIGVGGGDKARAAWELCCIEGSVAAVTAQAVGLLR